MKALPHRTEMMVKSPENAAGPEPGDILLPLGRALLLLKEPLYRSERAPGLAGFVTLESWGCRAVFAVRGMGRKRRFIRLSPRGERAFADRADARVLSALRRRELCAGQKYWDDLAMDREMREEG